MNNKQVFKTIVLLIVIPLIGYFVYQSKGSFPYYYFGGMTLFAAIDVYFTKESN